MTVPYPLLHMFSCLENDAAATTGIASNGSEPEMKKERRHSHKALENSGLYVLCDQFLNER